MTAVADGSASHGAVSTSSVAISRILHAPEQASRSGLRRPWVWPLPRLDGLSPRVLSPVDGVAIDGLELGYPGRSAAPDFVPVFAARDGVIAYAGATGGHAAITLDHPGGWTTQYADLARVLPWPTDRFRGRRKVRVQAGDVLGHARQEDLRIRFALRQLIDGERSIVLRSDAMLGWTVLPWFSEPASAARGSRAA